jgi:hypothetical protein
MAPYNPNDQRGYAPNQAAVIQIALDACETRSSLTLLVISREPSLVITEANNKRGECGSVNKHDFDEQK